MGGPGSGRKKGSRNKGDSKYKAQRKASNKQERAVKKGKRGPEYEKPYGIVKK